MFVIAPNQDMREKILGLEFGDDASKPAINVRALHGLKCGDALRAHLAQCIDA